ARPSSSRPSASIVRGCGRTSAACALSPRGTAKWRVVIGISFGIAGRKRPAWTKCRLEPFLDRSRRNRCLQPHEDVRTLPGMDALADLLPATSSLLEINLLGGFAVAVDGVGIPT